MQLSLQLGVATTVGAWVVLVFARERLMLYGASGAYEVGQIWLPISNALMISLVHKSEQGRLQGGLESVGSLVVMGAGLLFSFVFKELGAGYPFIIAALMSSLALFTALWTQTSFCNNNKRC